VSIHIAIPEPTSPLFVPDSAAYNQRSLPQYLHALHAAGATPIPVPLHESPQRVAKILSTCQGVLLPGSPADIDPQTYGESPIPACQHPDPARAAVDELLIQDAFNLHKPILAICQGLQALNIWCGGTLYQDLPTQLEPEASLEPSRSGLAPWRVNHAPDRSIVEAHSIAVTHGTRLASIIPLHDVCHPERTGAPGDRSSSLGRGSEGSAFRTAHETNGALRPLHEDPYHLYVNSSHHQAIKTPGDNLLVSARSPQDHVIEAVELNSPDHFVLAVQWHPERTDVQSCFSRNIFAAFVQAALAWTPRRIEESVLQG
jgi:putative glutamine amidotransferase